MNKIIMAARQAAKMDFDTGYKMLEVQGFPASTIFATLYPDGIPLDIAGREKGVLFQHQWRSYIFRVTVRKIFFDSDNNSEIVLRKRSLHLDFRESFFQPERAKLEYRIQHDFDEAVIYEVEPFFQFSDMFKHDIQMHCLYELCRYLKFLENF